MEKFVNILGYLRNLFLTVLLGLAVYYFFIAGNYFLKEKRAISIKKPTIIKTIIALISMLFLYRVISAGGFITTVLFTIFVGLILAYLLNPLVDKLEARNIKRTLSVVLVYLGIILIFVILFRILGPRVGSEITKLTRNLPDYLSSIYAFSIRFYERIIPTIEGLPFDVTTIEESVMEGLESIRNSIGNTVVNFANSFMEFISKAIHFVLIPVFAFYFLKDKEKFKQKIIDIIPNRFRKDTIELGRRIDKDLGQYIIGQLKVALFTGLATAVALSIIRIEFAIVIGIFAGIFDIIPYLGPIISLIPAVVFAALDDPRKVILVLIAVFIVQQLESAFVSPKLVGDSVGFHPTVVMVGVLLGGGYFGLMGMLLAVPAMAVIRILYKFVANKLRKMKNEELIPMD
jgi:predicted PurR-regulated permease PerM